MKAARAALIAASWLLAQPAAATLPERVAMAPEYEVSSVRLELASCGVRETLWIEHYAAGLYLPRGARMEAVADPESRRRCA